jgi:hypothetical protein
LSLEDLRRKPTVYLLPESENEEEARKYREEACGQVSKSKSTGDTVRIPRAEPADLDGFDRWFEWSFHSMVVDLCTIRPSKSRCKPYVHFLELMP